MAKSARRKDKAAKAPEPEVKKPELTPEAQETFKKLNEVLKQFGMLEMAMVSPHDCLPQQVNARYFTADTFEQLVNNIKDTGALESVPLVFQDDELAAKGKYATISGHHRIDAAKAANLDFIVVMVQRGITKDQLVSKQLSHNALTGVDDKGILSELFNSIKNVDLRMATGLSDEIAKVSYESLNFKIGTFKTFMIAFAPNDIEDYDKAVEELFEANVIPTDVELKIASTDTYDKFIDAVMRIKKLENIKSNAVALHRMVDIATVYIQNMENAKDGKYKVVKE